MPRLKRDRGTASPPGPGRTFAALLVLVAFVGALTATHAGAAPGDLDTSFSDDGKVWQRIGYPYDETGLNAVALQGRKIIAAGADIGAGGLIVARFKPSGKLDNSFSRDGSATLGSTVGPDDAASAVAVQPDRRIVVAGQVGGPDPDQVQFFVARYTPNGRLDRSFSDNGKARLGPGAASDVAIAPNGKIVVAGALGPDFAVVRLRPRGVPDSNFSGDGIATTDFGYDESQEASSLALQRDGRVVVAGTGTGGYNEETYETEIEDAILARYTRDGELDSSFSNGATTSIPTLSASDLALQPDGAIVAAGDGIVESKAEPGFFDGGFAVARFDPDGRLDPTFGDGGVALAPGNGPAQAMVLQRDGSIIAASAVYPDDTDPSRWGTDFFLARFTSSGALDPSFSEDGTLTTDFFGRSDAANALVLQGRKKVIAAGWADEGEPPEIAAGFALARYRLAD